MATVGLELSRSETTFKPFANVRSFMFNGETFTWPVAGIDEISAAPAKRKVAKVFRMYVSLK
jgi:hypothetical protein